MGVRDNALVFLENTDLFVVRNQIANQAMSGQAATLEQAVFLFADPDNWKFEHLEKDGKIIGGAWIWKGNFVPPWEFAQHALGRMLEEQNEKVSKKASGLLP